jgi:S-adenosylmethionine-diacylglycerol 3-amino-3-carboxypropyl transferase
MRRGKLNEGAPIHRREVFERLLFSQCWEDPRLDVEVLRPEPGARLVSITSGGCNTLELALHDPARIWALDMNAAQSHLLELKIAGIRCLTHGAYLELLGVRRSCRRRSLYRRCRDHMSAGARRYWDTQGEVIESGILRAGRYERYLEMFRRLLIVLHGRRRLERLFDERSLEERRLFYREEIDRPIWRGCFRLFFSRRVLGRFGLDPAFFTYVEGIPDFGEHFRSRVEHALVDLPPSQNYFVSQICLGRYLNERTMPGYLRIENFERLKRAVDRIVIVTDELEAFLRSLPPGSVDGFALSNVFEWIPAEVFERILAQVHRVARPGAAVCYRNLLVHRATPPALLDRFRPDRELGQRLLAQDRSFVYSHLEVARAVKSAPDDDGAAGPTPGARREGAPRLAIANPEARS